jgi:hypothetical protein
MAGVLFTLRLKRGMGTVSSAFIQVEESDAPTREKADADELKRAERLGHVYCDSHPGYKFVHIDRSVLCDETFLEHRGESPDEPAPVPVVPRGPGRPPKTEKVTP